MAAAAVGAANDARRFGAAPRRKAARSLSLQKQAGAAAGRADVLAYTHDTPSRNTSSKLLEMPLLRSAFGLLAHTLAPGEVDVLRSPIAACSSLLTSMSSSSLLQARPKLSSMLTSGGLPAPA